MNIEDFLMRLEDELEEMCMLNKISPSESEMMVNYQNDNFEIEFK